MDIGTKIREARAAAHLTQEQAAEALGVSRQTISNWENNRTYPDIVSVIRMSDLYSVSLDRLLKEKENKPMPDYIDYLEKKHGHRKEQGKTFKDHPCLGLSCRMGICTYRILGIYGPGRFTGLQRCVSHDSAPRHDVCDIRYDRKERYVGKV